MSEEILIKSKKRVRNHGEVFTPKHIVHKMLNLEGVREAQTDIYKTVLEPSAGEGVFLCELLKMRLENITKLAKDDIIKFENDSLIALSTLYGVELLEDNSQKCTMNLFETFIEYYINFASKLNQTAKDEVKKSAKTIISANILLGNFLTEKNPYGEDLLFSEWKIIGKDKKGYSIIQRTEYTLEEIRENQEKEAGIMMRDKKVTAKGQLDGQNDFFNLYKDDEVEEEKKTIKYIPVSIIKVYEEETEEI